MNETGGNGYLASHGAETMLRNTRGENDYGDFSGNHLQPCHAGDCVAPGYFGLGGRFSGSGSFLSPCAYGVADKLNTIDGSFTIAFWHKPDVDYVNGTGWGWSFGRQGLWRVGFYGPAGGPRFDVKDVGGQTRSVQARFPLYAGRWYHLAAVLPHKYEVGEAQWSTLELCVNGQLVNVCVCGTTYARDSTTVNLYLGWDQATNTRFTGLVDEFRLYRTSLAQDSIKGLLWFLRGSNNVLIPRGVFYESEMYEQLSGSYGNFSGANSPLQGAVVNGNSNPLSSNLNSRVVQMVIAKNVTLADAWRILDLARTNKTNNLTAFPFFATSEFYTLGFAWEVSKLAANTSVVNGGNWSKPPPPLVMWQLFWNTVAGWAEPTSAPDGDGVRGQSGHAGAPSPLDRPSPRTAGSGPPCRGR